MRHRIYSHKSAWLFCALLPCLIHGTVHAQNAAAPAPAHYFSAGPSSATSEDAELLLTDEPVWLPRWLGNAALDDFACRHKSWGMTIIDVVGESLTLGRGLPEHIIE